MDNEPHNERIAVLEKRITNLEELVNLIMTLKQKKVDISNFTCAPIKIDNKYEKLSSSHNV
jgi:hypothetical protein